MIVPGGGLAPDGNRWISCKPNFLLPVRALSKLFRRLMLTKLTAAYEAGQLRLFGAHAHLADPKAFAAFLAPLRNKRWFVYAKRPLAGPKAVLAHLSRYRRWQQNSSAGRKFSSISANNNFRAGTVMIEPL